MHKSITCFACLTVSASHLRTVFYNIHSHNKILAAVQYGLPEVSTSNSNYVLQICSSCYTNLKCFNKFKKKCLENYNQLISQFKPKQVTSRTQDQRENLETNKKKKLVSHKSNVHINVEDQDDDALMSWEEQHDQENEIDDTIEVKEESLSSETNTNQGLYQQLVKNELVSDDEQDGGSSISSAANNTSDDTDGNSSNIEADIEEVKCIMCNKTFSNELIYNTHANKHIESVENLNCPICKKTFSRRSLLKPHVRTHFGIKIFECEICKRKFGQNSYLARHKTRHHSDYNCSICKKKFTLKADLFRHTKLHKNH